MHISTAITLLTLVVQPHAQKLKASDTSDSRNSKDEVSKVVDELFDRALKAVHLQHEDLEGMTLGKPGYQNTLGVPSSANVKPFVLSHPSSRRSAILPPSYSVSSLAGYRPQFRREGASRKVQRCAIQYTPTGTLDRVDPNLTPGAVHKLKYMDRVGAPGFNEVQVRVYNIDRYGMSPLAAKALNKNIEAIWHVGVAVFGKEYWFGAIVEAQNLTEVNYAFGFGPSHVYNVGTTDVDPEEFHNWVFDKMAKSYDANQYDCFNHNCHHFANELVMKLTGKTPQTGGFPQWCLDHGEKALSEKTEDQAKQIAWVSNRIAKVMMISWGKYNRERFVSKGHVATTR